MLAWSALAEGEANLFAVRYLFRTMGLADDVVALGIDRWIAVGQPGILGRAEVKPGQPRRRPPLPEGQPKREEIALRAGERAVGDHLADVQ